MNKAFYKALIVFFLFPGFIATGETLVSPEASLLGGLSASVGVYAATHSGRLPESWNDLIISKEMTYDNLTRKISQGKNLTELYSFVATNHHARFPGGDLILVRYDSIAISNNEQVRWFLYRMSRGTVISTYWPEERFQAMLAETGITIPPPQPLPLPLEPLPPGQGQRPATPSQPSIPEPEPAGDPPAPSEIVRVPEPPVEQSPEPVAEEEVEETKNRELFWLVGGIAILLLLLAGWRATKRGLRTK